MSLPKSYKVLYGADKKGEDFEIADTPLPKLAKNQVLVKIQFAPLNPSDIMTIRGEGKYCNLRPHPVGLEGSGTIAAVGEDLRVSHKVGDKVHVHTNGTMGEYVVADSDYCSPIKEGLSFEEAASHYINPATGNMMWRYAQEGNHKAAIHTAGASALGKMLIRLFKAKGIKLINVVRREEHVEELLKDGADYVLNSQAADFEQRLKELARKENATIAFDAISGDFPAKVVKAQPANSICYVYGALSGNHEATINVWQLLKGKKLGSLLLLDYAEELRQKGELGSFLDETHSYLQTEFKSKILKVFKLDQIKEALAYYEENSSKGKILITPN